MLWNIVDNSNASNVYMTNDDRCSEIVKKCFEYVFVGNNVETLKFLIERCIQMEVR